MDQLTDDSKTADIAMSSPLNGERDPSVKRAIEVGFPIVEINRLAVPERTSFKPIYQMHKWFARRASCVFRAILLGTLKPAIQPDGTPTNLMAEFYKDHFNDPDTKEKIILDPFMGGGTTIIESLRLGCGAVGNDLNPVSWFIVKNETDPVDIEALNAAFDRLAERPVAWNEGRPLKESLLTLYKTDLGNGLEADVIYTFWVKSAICTDVNCRREVPLFKDYIIAQKTPKIRYHRDAICPSCRKSFDWEVQLASLIVEPALMVNAPRGSGGEGRPTTLWSYAPEPEKPRRRGDIWQTDVPCPHCHRSVVLRVPSVRKERKAVTLYVILCSQCETVWQWRGALPDGDVSCPGCQFKYDPRKGNVVEEDTGKKKTTFQCACGQKDQVIASIRTLPLDQRLPIRPYAIQAYLPIKSKNDGEETEDAQGTFFGHTATQLGANLNAITQDTARAMGVAIADNGKFFKRFTVSDTKRVQEAESYWEHHKSTLPYPQSSIPSGEKTKSGLLAHHYNYWREIFTPRQLLALSTLLGGILSEEDPNLREKLLCSFSACLELNNIYTRYMAARKSAGGQTAQGIFSRHDFQPKVTITENNVFGLPNIGMGSFISKFALLVEGIEYRTACWDFFDEGNNQKRRKNLVDRIPDTEVKLNCSNVNELGELPKLVTNVVTDPPYVGNVNYAELVDFYYVWLRLGLKDQYLQFAPEYTPKTEEIVENHTRGKSRSDFFKDLSSAFRALKAKLAHDGLLVFTFHHTDPRGLVWEGLLEAICDSGYEIVAIYPIQAESESSTHHQDKENISYDLIHVCQSRREDPRQRSWAGIRQDVRRKARDELQAIEAGRYGKDPLPEPDVRLICIGKCLELYSTHYGAVLDHENKPLRLHKALQDIKVIVDQLVTKDRPLPSDLGAVDALSYIWLKILARISNEITVDNVSKAVRGFQVSLDDLKAAGLLVRGRTGRGRTFEVKQPGQRLGDLLAKYQPALKIRSTQGELFTSEGQTIYHDIPLVDLVHLVIGLAQARESVVPWLERFAGLRSQLGAALRYIRDIRTDWKDAIDRVLALIEGAPLIRQIEEA